MANERFNLYVKEGALTIADTAATFLFNLPEFARLVGVRVLTEVASVGATLTMGTAATPALYVNAGDISGLGMSFLALLDDAAISGGPIPVYGSIGGAPGAGGPFRVFAEYITSKSVRVL